MSTKIPFAPPDITQKEIDAVVKVLKSGWITTGPETKHFELELATYCHNDKAICLNSATAGLELVLRIFDIGEGDEVITTPYTFAATANIILHVGAKPVFVDVKPGEFNIDPVMIADAITPRTKAIIPVDFGGFPVDYDEIYQAIDNKKNLYQPSKNTWQTKIDRPLLLADSAHSLGATYKNKPIGSVADFTVFSFHAVKNLTTAEGGAVLFGDVGDLKSQKIYKQLSLLSLHGQSKDAYSNYEAGSCYYSIELAGYKYNITDIASAMGRVQLSRYKDILQKRKTLYNEYIRIFHDNPLHSRLIIPPFDSPDKQGSHHLFPLRIDGFSETDRNKLIEVLATHGLATNIHYIPLPMQPFYKRLGYHINYYPEAFAMYCNEISLPLYSKLTMADINTVQEIFIKALKKA